MIGLAKTLKSKARKDWKGVFRNEMELVLFGILGLLGCQDKDFMCM